MTFERELPVEDSAGYTADHTVLAEQIDNTNVVYGKWASTALPGALEEIVPAVLPHEEKLVQSVALEPLGPEQEKIAVLDTKELAHCSQIIPNLYMGGLDAVAEPNNFSGQNGIRAVCCCCRELEFSTSDFVQDVQYYRVDVDDICREPIDLFLPEATQFVHECITNGDAVLVHCRAGISRSTTVVIAYLVGYREFSLHDAFSLVRSHRPGVGPNLGFMERLIEYEQAQRGCEPSIELRKYERWHAAPDPLKVPQLRPGPELDE